MKYAEYISRKMGRRFVGAELKESYYSQARAAPDGAWAMSKSEKSPSEIVVSSRGPTGVEDMKTDPITDQYQTPPEWIDDFRRMLTNTQSSARWWHKLASRADFIAFPRRRISFIDRSRANPRRAIGTIRRFFCTA